jgi:hypothetical protein
MEGTGLRTTVKDKIRTKWITAVRIKRATDPKPPII